MTAIYVTATRKLPQGQFRHLPERTLPQRTFLVCFPNFRDNYFCNLTLFVNLLKFKLVTLVQFISYTLWLILAITTKPVEKKYQ